MQGRCIWKIYCIDYRLFGRTPPVAFVRMLAEAAPAGGLVRLWAGVGDRQHAGGGRSGARAPGHPHHRPSAGRRPDGRRRQHPRHIYRVLIAGIAWLGLIIIVWVAGKMVYEGFIDPNVGLGTLFT